MFTILKSPHEADINLSQQVHHRIPGRPLLSVICEVQKLQLSGTIHVSTVQMYCDIE